MINEGVNHSIRKSVLFVDEHPKEDGIRSGVLHFSELQHGGTSVKNWNGGLREDRRHDDGLAKCARSTLKAERIETEVNTCNWLIQYSEL